MAQPNMKTVLDSFGIQAQNAGTWIGRRSLLSDQWISSSSPVDGGHIAQVSETTTAQYHEVIEAAQAAQAVWRDVPAQSAAKLFAFLVTNCASKKMHSVCWYPMKWVNPTKKVWVKSKK